ncbi:MAG: hypothetical protein IPP17_22000 [Bacteroidetes bacterium]|nr:hypothetical protein [Bacteroidota bacterium]
MSEKVDEYPYFRIKPSDRLLIFDMGRANILEASPVYLHPAAGEGHAAGARKKA